MKFCMSHWNAIRDEIENKRGLKQFIARSGKEVCRRLVEQVTGERAADEGDPLMDAHNLIVSNALDRYGLALFVDNEDGSEKCPLCMVDTPCGNPDCANCGPGQAERWIGFAGCDVAELWARRVEVAAS